MTSKTHIPVLGAITPPPRRRSTTPSAPIDSAATGSAAAAIFLVLLFILSLPTETGAWLWGGPKIDALTVSAGKLVIPQYSLWAVLPFAIIMHLNAHGMTYYKRTLGIFVPFLIIGLVSAFQGIFPIISVHLMTLWLACASVCVVVAGGLNTRQVARLLFYSVLIELVLSIILAVLFKSVGTSHDSRVSAGVSWNGVFQGRILLGMMASWGLLLSLFRKYVGWIPSLVMAACAALCLYESHAAGDVVAAASSLAFAVAIMLLRRTTLSTVSKAWTLGLGSLAAVTGVLTLSPIILKALGRDATLTGRTEIWQAYIPRALERPILGQGPGSFSVPSQVTAELFYRLAQWGDIRTPHSMYIALLGEVGVLGLAAALGAWFYVAFVLPFRTQNLTTLICGAGAVLIMVNGFSESSMLYEPSLSLFIFLMLFASRNDAPKIAPNSRYARGLATVR